jgi:hypothetical protein
MFLNVLPTYRQGGDMDNKKLVLVRTEGRKIVPMTLAEWAKRFNADHRLPDAKGGK